MPQRKSAKKELRKNLKRRNHNLFFKQKIKLAIKDFNKAIKTNDLNKTREELKKVYKVLDQAVSKKIIHQNRASKKKSQLTRLLNKIKK